jgi:hypothetical protein
LRTISLGVALEKRDLEPERLAQVRKVCGLMLGAALTEDGRDGIVPLRFPRTAFRDGPALLAQVRATEMVREIRRGEPEPLVDETHRSSIACSGTPAVDGASRAAEFYAAPPERK